MLLDFLLRYRRRRWDYYRRILAPVDMRRTMVRSAIALGIIFVLHTAAMMIFEGLVFGDAAWLTLSTMTTVGYGDHAAATPWGRLCTVFLLYLCGIFVLFHTAADYFEYRTERRYLMMRGRWRCKLTNHVLILSAPQINQVQFLSGLIGDLQNCDEYRGAPVEMLTTRFPDGLPPELQHLGLILHTGHPNDPHDIAATDPDRAAAILVLAHQEEDKRSDAKTFDIVCRLREMGATGRILAECVDDGNRQRLKNAGANVVVRPVRFYPEVLVRALTSPGSSEILENLFTSRGDMCVRVPVEVRGLPWSRIVRALMDGNAGTAIGYEASTDHSVHCNPSPDTLIDASALQVIVREGRMPEPGRVDALLRGATG